MRTKFEPQTHTKKTLAIGLAWLLLWIVPWGNLPQVSPGNVWAFLTEMPRLALALILFIIPGSLLYLLLHPAEKPAELKELLPIGMTFSIAISSLIGFLGRVLGTSFLIVEVIFVLIGAVEFLLLAYSLLDNGIDKKSLISSFRSGLKNPPHPGRHHSRCGILRRA